jgi:hypothetical protein
LSAWSLARVLATALALVMAIAIVSGLVVANWSGRERAPEGVTTVQGTAPLAPTAATVSACNQWAAQQAAAAGAGQTTSKDAGRLYGLDENRKHDERYRAAYAICLRARGYAV